MQTRTLVPSLAIVTGFLLLLPAASHAQFGDRLKRAAKEAAESETAAQVDRIVRNEIRCLANDPACYEEARESGQEVVFVDEDGEVLVDESGEPISDPDAARAASPAAPGQDVRAGDDFVPGERTLFQDDYARDNVSDFPRRFGFVNGSWDVTEWQGRRLLRNLGPRGAAIRVPLPESLPETFTIEFSVHFPHGNQQLLVATSEPEAGTLNSGYDHNVFKLDGRESGVAHLARGPESTTGPVRQINEGLAPVRIMVDGKYAKMYVGQQRVANIPVADLPRGDALWIQNTNFANEEHPIHIGPIRVAAGGTDLYDALETEGRVAVRGILFATDSDRIRSESAPVLEEIAAMLEEHSGLRLGIEGHTDGEGDAAYNMELSERRAAAVKQYLVERHGIDTDRLETAGYGESRPVADNDTPEGKQQNRRVELVRLEG